jgi:hypothetical protein
MFQLDIVDFGFSALSWGRIVTSSHGNSRKKFSSAFNLGLRAFGHRTVLFEKNSEI